jgi:hypothetical protein
MKAGLAIPTSMIAKKSHARTTACAKTRSLDLSVFVRQAFRDLGAP